MSNTSNINGNKNIVIQGVNDSNISVSVNGEVEEIKNELSALKKLLENHQQQTFKIGEKIYDIGEIGTANFQIVIQQVPFKPLKYLTNKPMPPELFLGREADIEAVHKKLFSGQNLLLLVNGRGGIGKTTFASKYYYQYHEKYTHLAWVFVEKNLLEALLILADSLQLKFEVTMPNEQRLQELLKVMGELEKPCLLVVDNANEPEELEKYYPALQSCPNFHILLTTRVTELKHPATKHSLGTLSKEKAKELFCKHYPAHLPEEDILLEEIMVAVGYNTLVIELLAKNLNNFNDGLESEYPLMELLKDLVEKGLFGIETQTIETIYHADKGVEVKGLQMREEKTEAILGKMYELNDLPELERQLLSVFSVLPAEAIPYATVKTLLPELEKPNKPLRTLAKNGWLEYDKEAQTFKISPVIQEVVREKNKTLLWEEVRPLLSQLIDKLEYQPGVGHLENATYEEAAIWVRYASFACSKLEKIFDVAKHEDNSLAKLYQRQGNYSLTTGNIPQAYEKLIYGEYWNSKLLKEYPENEYFKNDLVLLYSHLGNLQTAQGDLDKALEYYLKYEKIAEELVQNFPEDSTYKSNWAISYGKLGETYSSLGNLQKALSFFEGYNLIEKELHETYPQDVTYKNLLAVTYSLLGNAHSSLGNLEKTLENYEKGLALVKELYESYPQNVSFKNGLAISYEKLGSTHSSLGNLEKALEFFELRSQLGKELYESYPQNVSFKNGLAISYEKLGSTHSSLGNLEKALANYEKDLALTKELYESYPENVSFKNGLAISYAKLAQFYLESDLQKGLEYLRQAEKLLEELTTQYPSYAQFQQYYKIVKEVIKDLEK